VWVTFKLRTDCLGSAKSGRLLLKIRWDRPSPFVVCRVPQDPRWPSTAGWATDDQRRSSVPPLISELWS